MKLEHFKTKLATPSTSVQLCLLGIIGGICAASMIILFRLGIDYLQLLILEHPNDYTTLGSIQRLILPLGGAILIIAFAYLTGFKHYRLGIPFVIHRVSQHYGLIPFRTTLNQFFGGMFALASGFTVGREGPSVHIGAASSSFLGYWLRLPNNSIRILAGCGMAAAISASFNTPFAAVIFVMEVVLREYRIHIFIPIMLAAACGSVLTRLVFGEVHELSFLGFTQIAPSMYLYLIVFGMALGTLATFFNNQVMRIIQNFRHISMVRRLLLAGMITGIIGFALPESLGSGFEKVHEVIASQDMQMVMTLMIAKVFLTLVAIGLGIPGGIIGPVFVIGMLAGSVFFMPLAAYLTNAAQYTNSFMLLGIAGFLTAVLHAPLAALSAVMELSNNPDVILPAMLVIVPAYVTAQQFLGNKSIFIRQLDYQELPYTTKPVHHNLQKTGVLAIMHRDFQLTSEQDSEALLASLKQAENCLLIQEKQGSLSIVQLDVSLQEGSPPVTFSDMPGLPCQSTLDEVYEALHTKRDGAVYIYDRAKQSPIGVITWADLQQYLHKEHF